MDKIVYYYLHNSSVIQVHDSPLLSENGYNVGEDFTDVQNGKVVPLSGEQVAFYKANPSAQPQEIWGMELTPPPPPHVPTLEEVKAQKLAELHEYDNSAAVNEFFFGGMPLWIDKATRLVLKDRIEREEAAGMMMTTLRFGALRVELPIVQASAVLNALMFYADQAYDTTADHELAIIKLETEKEVEEYDFTAGYPPKLNF